MKPINWRMVALLTTASISTAHAGGYEAKAWSSKSIGEATAGSSVKWGDISTMSRNPAAALGGINKHGVDVSVTSILPKLTFSNNGSVLNNPGVLLTGGNGGQSGKAALVPAAYAAWSHNDRLKFGLAVTAPWGLSTKYDADWVGRYHALESKMISVHFLPAFAYKMTQNWTLGGALQIQYMQVELSKAINMGSLPTTAGVSQNNDGQVRLKGQDWGVGFNVATTYKPLRNVLLGLSYNSHVHHKLRGDTTYTFPTPGIQGALVNTANFGTFFQNQSAETALTTPERVIAGASWEFLPDWTALGEVTYTRWGRMQQILLRQPGNNGVAPVLGGALSPLLTRAARTEMNWSNTVAIAVGLNWQPASDWTLRTGFQYDPTPVRDDRRVPAAPDQSRYWAALGATWEPMADLSVSLNYAHEFLPNTKSQLNPLGDLDFDQTKGTLLGSYKASVDLISAQVGWKF